jgi:hypothetical protein
MRMIRVLTLLATAAVVFSASAKPSAAMVIYPWCAEYGGKMGGSENCGFVNFRQCLATIAGNGGWCKPNPWYTPYHRQWRQADLAISGREEARDRSSQMLVLVAMTILLTAASAAERRNDHYPWCVEYGGRGRGECRFVTFKQCLATIAGNGGFCKPNP